MTKQLLFIHGAGDGAYKEDQAMVDSTFIRTSHANLDFPTNFPSR